MKSNLLFFGLMLFAQISLAQTNTFPPNGNAGVGTTTPENTEGWDKVFEVKGFGHSKIISSTNSVTTGLWSHSLGYFGGPIGGFNGTATNHSFSLITNAISRMTIAPNGNIGIGTSSPEDLFDLDAGPMRKGLTLRGSGESNVYNDIMFVNKNSASIPVGRPKGWVISHRKDGYFSGSNAEGSSLEFYAYNAGGGYFAPLSFKSNGDLILVSNLRDAVSGNVGIGTATPKEKLSVNGKVRAWEIKVENTNWPDYVFDREYQLLSLSETEKSIKENGHLPGIPSAADIKSNGVDLGEMNAKLLQKIEELTLHLIEQEKQWKSVVAKQQETNIQLFEQVKKLNNQSTIKSHKANKS